MIAVLSVVACFSGALPTSVANDIKTYTGTHCVEENDLTPEISYNFARATNTAAGNNTWECPVVRDSHAGDIPDWDVTVHRGGNTTDAWTIFLYSCDEDGSCNNDSITVPLVDGVQTLDGDAVTAWENYGAVNIETSVPADCRIYSYVVQEDDP